MVSTLRCFQCFNWWASALIMHDFLKCCEAFPNRFVWAFLIEALFPSCRVGRPSKITCYTLNSNNAQKKCTKFIQISTIRLVYITMLLALAERDSFFYGRTNYMIHQFRHVFKIVDRVGARVYDTQCC